jgi:hypothetical protein
MTPALRSSNSRSRWFWLALALSAIAQLNVIVVLPFADANVGRSAPAHVEAYGTTTHYTHDDANCAACVARQAMGRTVLAVRVSLPLVQPMHVSSSVVLPAIALDRFSVTSPRAPPAQREL